MDHNIWRDDDEVNADPGAGYRWEDFQLARRRALDRLRADSEVHRLEALLKLPDPSGVPSDEMR